MGKLTAIPAIPPESVLAEVARAADVADELESKGLSLRFERDHRSRRLSAEVVHTTRGPIGKLTGKQVLELAGGVALDQHIPASQE